MADAQANINVNLDATRAIAQLKVLQRQISSFHQSMAIGGAKARAESSQLAQTLINNVNASGKFSASIQRTLSTTESFTNSLERNKLSMGQYFKFGMGATKSFGKMFSSEFNTINKVARERTKTLQTQYIQMGRDASGAMQSIAVRPLTLDMKNLGTQVMMNSQRQQIFNQLLRQGSTNLLNFGKNTQWAGRQLMVGFTIPLSIMGATAAKEFMKLEEQAVKFRRVYGDMFTTDAETEKALANVRELADEFTKYGIAVEKTIDLAAKVAQMGNMGDALEAQVTQATRLAVLGGLEQQEALDTTISLTNAFGVSAQDLAGKIAFLNAAENQTILAIEDFNEAIPKAGSVVQQLGGSVEDLAFFLTAMREGGINASQGANALKSSLGRLINPTEAARSELAGFGIDILSIVENNAGNLRDMVMDLGGELDKLDPLNRARAIEQLFGKFQFARMSTMFQNITKDGSQARKVLDLTAQSTEELAILAERELSRVEDSIGFKFKKQLENLQASLAPIGGEFIKAVTPIIEGATKILKWFNGLGDGAKQFAVIAVAAVGVIAPTFLMLFGLVANGFANFIKGISKVGSFLGVLSGQSKMVGGSISYMTQEQIEAQSVSSSLEQTHQRLYQLFTSESAAVDTLAAAYGRAAAQMSSLNSAGAGRAAAGAAGATSAAGAASTKRYNPFIPPKKYNKGVVMVPGPKGKGDIVPAMLTPGEAVIPAEETRKYLPLIKGIVDDNLPGYQESNVDQITRQLGGKSFNVRPGTDVSKVDIKLARLAGAEQTAPGVSGMVADELGEVQLSVGALDTAIKKVNDSANNFVRIVQTLPEANAPASKQGVIASHGTGQTKYSPEEAGTMATQLPQGQLRSALEEASTTGKRATGYSELVFGESAAFNENIATGEERGDFFRKNQDITSAPMQESGYLNLEDSQQATDYSEFTNLVATKLEQAGSQAVSESDFQQIVANSLEEMTEGAAKQGMQAASQEIKSVSIEGKKKESGQPDKRRFEVPGGKAFTGSKLSKSKTERGGYQSHTAKVRKKFDERANQATRDLVTKRVQGAGKGDVSGIVSKDAQEDAQEYSQTLEQALESTSQDPYMYVRDRMSPHEMSGPDGKSDATEYGTEFANTLNQQSSNLTPPAPPSAGSQPSSRFSKFKDRAKSFGTQAIDRFMETAPGQSVGNYFAETSGANITNSKGEVVASPTEQAPTQIVPRQYPPGQSPSEIQARNQALVDNKLATFDAETGTMFATTTGKIQGLKDSFSVLDTEISELGDTAQDSAFDVDNHTQSVKENGDTAQRAAGQQELAPDPRTGEMVPKAQADKIARKEDRRQRRQSRASKAMMGFGAVTGGLAAATQLNVEIPGIGNIGEFAQKLLPVTGALTAIAPILLALPLPIAALVAVIGAGVYLWMRHNKQLKEATEKARKLAVGLGVGNDAMQKFAEFAGTVAPTELMNERRQLGTLPIAAGKSEFGESFIGSEQGSEYVKTVEEGITEIGRSGVIEKLGLQLSTAVASNVLTQKQAAGIAVELGRAVGDLSLGVGIAAEISKFVGPNGEEEPLPVEVFAKIIEASSEGVAETLEDLTAKALDEDAFTGFFNFDKETLQSELAAGILGQAEQVQQAIDAQTVATNDRVKALQEEGRQLAANGKQEEANAKFDEARTAQREGDAARLSLLEEQRKTLESTTGEMFRVFEASKLVSREMQNALAVSDDKGLSEEIDRQVRESLLAIEKLNNVDFGDVENMSQSELADVYYEAYEQAVALDKQQEAYNGTLTEMGKILEERFGADSTAFEKIDQIITNGDLDFELKYNLVVGVGSESLDLNDVDDFLQATTLDPENISQEEVYEYQIGQGGFAQDLTPEAEADIKEEIAAYNKSIQDAFSNIDSSLGDDASSKITQIFGKLENDEFAKELTLQVNTLIDEGDEEKAQALLDTMGQLAAYDAGPITPEVILDTYLNDPKALEEMQAALAEIETFFGENAGPDGKVTHEQVISQDIIRGGVALETFKQDSEYFNSLDPFQQYLYVQTLLTVEDTLDMDEYQAWLAKNPTLARNVSEGRIEAGYSLQMYLRETAQDVVGSGMDLGGDDGGDPPGPEPKGGSGEAKDTSILDPIVKSSRDFGNSAQELTTGFEASLAAIMEFSEGGAWGLNGLARQLRNVNVSETMIEKFLGMEPEEWDKYKDKLFEVDENDNIVGLTEEGEAVQQAEASATIAEETDSIEAQTKATQNQLTAFDKLVAGGASVKMAYDMIQNENIASAVATSKNTAEVKRLISAQQELAKLEAELEEIDEEEQRKERIRDAIKDMNKEFDDQVKALNKIRKATDEYSDAQIEAIMGNKDLRSLFLEPNIAKGALKKALENAEKREQLELDIQLLTFDGRENFLNEAFKKAKDKFSAEETRIELEFDADVAGAESIIQEAENEINSMTYAIDDYQAQLDEIQYREDEINEKYDKRFEALDKIASINDRIAAQQQTQLDLAEALSRGDIAAAAQAAQASREQEMTDNMEAQREMLEMRREAELESLTLGGMTRKQLEDQIDTLNRRISEIEETRLEPQEEYIRLAELRRDAEIENLEVMGRSSSQWDQIQNALDVARTRNFEFMNEMQRQFSMYPEILAKYLEGEPLPPPPKLPPPPPPPRRRVSRPSKWEGGRKNGRSREDPPGPGGHSAAMGGLITKKMAMGGMMKGGMFKKMSLGGMVPRYLAYGGKALGSDTIPTMLTPGEFVIRRPAVNEFGVDNLTDINRGTYQGNSMYNYNLSVNVKSDSNPEQIANTVMREIKRVDSQRMRNNRY
jgi:TP901 family phage tail tape measure protein